MSDHEEVTDPKETLEIQNVVASTAVGQELNLESVAMDLEGADFDREQFPGVVYQVQEPDAVALIFRSGKIVCTGAGSVPAVHEALAVVFEILCDLGIDVGDNPDIEVQNIVTSGDLGETLNLNAIAIGLGLEDVEYEPEQFPGLVHRLDEPDVVVLLFGSGKFVIVGGEVPADAEAATEVIISKLTDLGLFR
ncbi:TATA-box-binding protein (plasmid) [Halococcus dombrowskii]|uniref:TATA-box-binding protein n=1 Tax=Halococcus dombrowskii TaxID=179637 RepID=A0AAV3SHQ1_HALDO|nr:TATA-box-binding protein [Halococcus dombrowskii]UOO97280.1 TATA-box-binding protein [Halococcus dombrowskii]